MGLAGVGSQRGPFVRRVLRESSSQRRPMPARVQIKTIVEGIHEYRMMERFAHTLAPAEADAALRALQGRGAFRHFKDTVHRPGLAKAWYAYRDDAYQAIARDWRDAHGVTHDGSPS